MPMPAWKIAVRPRMSLGQAYNVKSSTSWQLILSSKKLEEVGFYGIIVNP